jgi:hypothetical protein
MSKEKSGLAAIYAAINGERPSAEGTGDKEKLASRPADIWGSIEELNAAVDRLGVPAKVDDTSTNDLNAAVDRMIADNRIPAGTI